MPSWRPALPWARGARAVAPAGGAASGVAEEALEEEEHGEEADFAAAAAASLHAARSVLAPASASCLKFLGSVNAPPAGDHFVLVRASTAE